MRVGLVFDNVLWSKPLVSLHKLGASHAGATSEPSSPKSCEYKKFNRNRKINYKRYIASHVWEPRTVPILCRPHGSKLDSPKHVNTDTSPHQPLPVASCHTTPTTLNNKDFSNVFLPSLAYIEFRQWGLSALYSFLAPSALNPPHPFLLRKR